MSGIFDQVINYAPPSLLTGTVTYKGTWSAATNTPTLANPPSAITNGNYYVVSAAGTQFSLVFNIGDWIISNGTAWEKVDNTDAVSSVFGRTGAVVGVSTDYSSVGITATAVGASSPSTGAFTTLSATTPLAVASGGTGVASSTGTTNVVLSGSPTITTPVIAQINDGNGNETLKLASIASAVNEVTIENAATGNAVHISATGGDASVGLHLAGKGASGYVNVQDSTDATKRIMFNASGGTTNTRTMLSSTQTVDRTLSLPDATDTLVGVAATQTLTNKTLTSPTLTAPVLGTPASGTVTNLTGTASININGIVGATTANTGAFTTIAATGLITSTGDAQIGSASKMLYFRTYSGINRIDSYDNPITTTVPLSLNASTYTFQVADVTRGTLTSTGLNSIAIGATTPSTGAFTTVSATDNLTLSTGVISRGQINGSVTGPLAVYDIIPATGNNRLISFGKDNSTNGFFTVSSTRANGSNNVDVASFTSAGAAITGTLSATTSISAGSGSPPTAGIINSVGTVGFATSDNASSSLYIRNGSGGTIIGSDGGGRIRIAAGGNTSSQVVAEFITTGLEVYGALSATGATTSASYVVGTGTVATSSITTNAANGMVIIGKTGTSTDFYLGQPGTTSSIMQVATGTVNVVFAGSVSKGSGSFRIDHPLPSKSATHQLVHSFIEGPKCDLIYRGKVDLVKGKASVNIDADSTMTEGTFEALCATVQCFTSNESGWGAIRGKVVGNILTIEAQDAASTDNVSWMVIGERKDKHIMDTDWTDKNGRPIVEPLKPAVAALESK